jgi:hypothetical protein
VHGVGAGLARLRCTGKAARGAGASAQAPSSRKGITARKLILRAGTCRSRYDATLPGWVVCLAAQSFIITAGAGIGLKTALFMSHRSFCGAKWAKHQLITQRNLLQTNVFKSGYWCLVAHAPEATSFRSKYHCGAHSHF